MTFDIQETRLFRKTPELDVQFGGLFSGIGHFLANAAKTAGRAVHSAVHLVHKATGAIADAVGHVPLIGPGLHAVYDQVLVAPFAVADGVMSGQRIDHVLVDRLKQDVANARAVAPYAQAVVSVVPGIGTGVSGVIGGGLALANGQPITEALVEGVKGSVPGGQLGQMMFEVGHAAMQGKPIEEIAARALPIPDASKELLVHGLSAAHKIAHGDNIAHTVVNDGMAVLPPEARKALQIGMAVGHGQSLQSITQEQLSSALTKEALAKIGDAKILGDRTLQAGATSIPLVNRAAFAIGTGVMAHHVAKHELELLRNQFVKPEDKKAFDAALAMHIGRVTSKPPPKMPPRARAGYYMVHGISSGAHKQKQAILNITKKDPVVMKGAHVAALQIAEAHHASWWEKVKSFLTKLKS